MKAKTPKEHAEDLQLKYHNTIPIGATQARHIERSKNVL